MKKAIILMSLLMLNNNRSIGYCDIKGNVKNPGVYEIKKNYTIQDVINLAGGLKSNSVTDNINLSKKVTDEMVIYIFNKNELKELKCNCNNYEYKCVENFTDAKNESEINEETFTTEEVTIKKININIATLEELKTLKGLGESKAQSIIDYRNENGLFTSIEELLNVKGIGEVLFESIKDFIEV